MKLKKVEEENNVPPKLLTSIIAKEEADDRILFEIIKNTPNEQVTDPCNNEQHQQE